MAILNTINSDYHKIIIEEEYPIRKLCFGKGSCREQSAIDLTNLRLHVYDYTKLLMHAYIFSPMPKRILFIGLGGGVVPRESEFYFNSLVNIDIIEIDPVVVQVAKDYFFFNESKKTSLILGDALDVVKKIKDQYDIVFIDAYDTNYIPLPLTSIEFIESIYPIVSDNGLIAVNASSFHPSFYPHLNAIYSVFGNNIYITNGFTNILAAVIFASKKDLRMVCPSSEFCHFLSQKPEKAKITSNILNAKIFSLYNDSKE